MSASAIHRVAEGGGGLRGRRFGAALAAVLLLLVLAGSATAQPITIRHPAATQASGQAESQPADGMNLGRVTLALGAVVSLILLFKWGARRFLNGGAASGQSRAVQILTRTVVAPRQQMMLVKVGRRLVLVSNTSAGMNSLCEIRDEQEVAELLGQISADSRDSVSRAFGSLFRREEEKFRPDAPEEGTPTGADAEEQEVAAVSATRDELSGLMEKVRQVSKQFRRS